MLKLLSDANKRIAQYAAQGRQDEDKLKPALQAFLEWLPDDGKVSIARDILGATTDDLLHQVFLNLFTTLAVPMKTRSHAGSVRCSPHPHRLDAEEAVASTLDDPLEREKKFRDMCLRRDNYCCVVSGDMDVDKFCERGSPEGVISGDLEVAHIVPFSYVNWNTSTPLPQASTIWEALMRCFPGIRQIGLSAETINHVFNGLTMEAPLHSSFGSFRLAFKRTDILHTYQCMTYSDFPTRNHMYLPENDIIKLKQALGAEDLPLPNPVLIDCHYRLAEILNASGMGERIDEHWRRWEDIKGSTAGHMLSPDGYTDLGCLLETAFWHCVRS